VAHAMGEGTQVQGTAFSAQLAMGDSERVSLNERDDLSTRMYKQISYLTDVCKACQLL
jgi:hypothetical protein